MAVTGDLSQVGIMEGSGTALTLQRLRSKQEMEVGSRRGKRGWQGEKRRRKQGLVYVRVFG